MENPFEISQLRKGFLIMLLLIFMKISPVIFGLAQQTEQAVTMGNPSEISK
jgi:hypothetical protein